MNYMDSDKPIRVGDEVTYAGTPGTIVFIVEDDSYSPLFSREHWSYLGKGFGIQLRDTTGTLYVFDHPDEDLVPSTV
jgi:hypothetical protein